MARGTVLPVNRALNRPILIAGVEKRFVLLNALLCFPLVAATHLHMPACLFGVVLYVLLHVVFVLISKRDPHLGKVLKRSTRYCFRPYFPAHSHPQHVNVWKVRSVSRPL